MNTLDKNTANKQVVIFIHIRKTAGTTLRRIIQHQFQPNNVFEFYRLLGRPPYGIHKRINEFNKLSDKQKNAIEFVGGHVGFGLHELFVRPCTYITVLRNPVDRVISYYYALLRNKNDFVKNKTLEDFIQSEVSQNNMTCHLSGLTLKSQLGDASIDLECGRSSNKTLELAKNNLKDHFKVFCILERFDESLILLNKTLDWEIPLYKKNNVAKNRPAIKTLSKETLTMIENFNELDIQLYKYATELFEEHIKQQDISFEREVEKFKEANKLSKTKFYFKAHTFYNHLVHGAYKKLVRHQ